MPQFIDEPITVSVKRMRQIDDLDGSGQGGADFFSKITIDGKRFDGPKFNNRDDLNPGNAWTFTNTAAQRSVLIKIEVDESDGAFDDDIDINPIAGKRDLLMRYDPGTGILTHADNNNVIFPDANGVYKLQGAGDSDKGAIEFTITGFPGSEAENSLLTQNQFPGQTALSNDRFGTGVVAGDFNADGRDDLVIGASAEGKVHSILGSAGGLNIATGQTFDNSVLGTVPTGALAVGNVDGLQNGKVFQDLVVGGITPVLFFGTNSGLLPGSKQTIQQDSFFAGAANSQFGSSVVIADFNNDGFGDVVTGAPNAQVFGVNSGAVQVTYGSAFGLSSRREVFHRAIQGIPGLHEAGDRFGSALAAGDFDGDGFKDLAVGAAGAGDLVDGAGAVHILYGSANGVSTRNQILAQSFIGQPVTSGDQFGGSLAAGDFNRDGVEDLAVGAPGDNIGVQTDAGSVFIYYGRRGQQLNQSQAQHVVQSFGTLGSVEANDQFGHSLAARDINNDGAADLVVTAPFEDEDNFEGVAHVLFGSNTGISVLGTRLLKQGAQNVAGTPEIGDFLGSGGVTIGNFDGTGNAEVALGVPLEDFGNVFNAGAVNIIAVPTTSPFSSNIQSATKATGVQTVGTNTNGLIVGNARNNRIFTRGGDDIALGGAGKDYLHAGDGDDLLDGGKGNDTLVGGRDRDVFVLKPNEGVDIIKDFQDGIDYIGLGGGLEFGDLQIVSRGSNTGLRHNNTRLAVLENVNASQITAGDFLLVGETQIMGFNAPLVLV